MEELRPGGSSQALVYVSPSKAPGSALRAEQSSLHSWGVGRGLSAGLTCPSLSAAASQSAGAASGLGEPRLPTHSTCCSTGCPHSWARGRVRWWHCGLSRHRELRHRAQPLRHRAGTQDRTKSMGRHLHLEVLHSKGFEALYSTRWRAHAHPAFLTNL